MGSLRLGSFGIRRSVVEREQAVDDYGRRRVAVFGLFFVRMGTKILRLASTRRHWQTVPRS